MWHPWHHQYQHCRAVELEREQTSRTESLPPDTKKPCMLSMQGFLTWKLNLINNKKARGLVLKQSRQ